MTPTVAIIGTADDDKSVDYLRNALRSRDVDTNVCPSSQPREILRWAMDLSPAETRLCIFADTDGRLTASITTALHPGITSLVWCPAPAEPERLTTVLSDTPALLCFAHDPTILAGLARNLCSQTTNAAAATSFSQDAKPAATIRNSIAEKQQLASQTTDDDAEDLALYQQLETMMAAPVKDLPKHEPVPIQQAGLDFSIPLRRLMTQGRSLAHKSSHTEVLGAHYLVALDEPYLSAFKQAGLDIDLVKDYLSGFDSGEDITSEPVISDEVFDAVSEAKRRARATDRHCVRVLDFLYGLLQGSGTSVMDILNDAGLSTDALLDAIAPLDAVQENCAAPFFRPSSLDQASFYQFDPDQVKSVEGRLRNLPGFQKAAERVAEARGKQAGMAEAQKAMSPAGPAPVAPLAPAVPPDKPEILKISGEFPDVDVIEHVADRLLEGHIVAFPSDIMFAVAVDATNAAAVDQLRQAAQLPEEKPLSILINSTGQLKHLAKADLDALEDLFDELWPGPLTLVFTGAGAAGRNVASAGTIAVRQPSDNITLAILSMLGRPLAVTSWDKPKDELTGHAAVIISSDSSVTPTRTTIVDLTKKPWQVLREGAVPGQSVMRFHK